MFKLLTGHEKFSLFIDKNEFENFLGPREHPKHKKIENFLGHREYPHHKNFENFSWTLENPIFRFNKLCRFQNILRVVVRFNKLRRFENIPDSIDWLINFL